MWQLEIMEQRLLLDVGWERRASVPRGIVLGAGVLPLWVVHARLRSGDLSILLT